VLALKPSCEHCDRELPPESTLAMICSYECTFCKPCVETVLNNVCPNCGGGFEKRPIRPKQSYLQGVGLAAHPASTDKVFQPVAIEKHRRFIEPIKDIPPEDR